MNGFKFKAPAKKGNNVTSDVADFNIDTSAADSFLTELSKPTDQNPPVYICVCEDPNCGIGPFTHRM